MATEASVIYFLNSPQAANILKIVFIIRRMCHLQRPVSNELWKWFSFRIWCWEYEDKIKFLSQMEWNGFYWIKGKKNIGADIQSSFDFIFIDFSGSKNKRIITLEQVHCFREIIISKFIKKEPYLSKEILVDAIYFLKSSVKLNEKERGNLSLLLF